MACPAASAISRQPCLKMVWLSAASSASAKVMLISCWPKPVSPFENSIGIARRQHVVADLADDGLVPRGLQHVVVDHVRGRGARHAVAAVGELTVRVHEQIELELARHLGGEARLAGLLELPLEDRAGGDLDRLAALFVVEVADHHGRLVDPRADAQRREVRHHGEVAVAGLPRGELVARGDLGLDVHGQQVLAGMQTGVGEHLLEEVARHDALADEAALHVGEHAQDGVDLAGRRQLLKLGQVQVAGQCCLLGICRERTGRLVRRTNGSGAAGARPPRPTHYYFSGSHPAALSSDVVCVSSRPPAYSTSTSSRSRSIAASSSGVPWTFGPLNHFRAETAYQMPAPPTTTPTATGV